VFSARLEILPDAQRRLWPALRPLKALGFVLYGGTAIALRLGHRHSVDFDFFCSDGLDQARLAAMLPFLRSAELLQAETDSWVWRVPLDEGEVRVRCMAASGLAALAIRSSPMIRWHGSLRLAIFSPPGSK
jgi:hypothetical protein